MLAVLAPSREAAPLGDCSSSAHLKYLHLSGSSLPSGQTKNFLLVGTERVLIAWNDSPARVLGLWPSDEILTPPIVALPAQPRRAAVRHDRDVRSIWAHRPPFLSRRFGRSLPCWCTRWTLGILCMTLQSLCYMMRLANVE